MNVGRVVIKGRERRVIQDNSCMDGWRRIGCEKGKKERKKELVVERDDGRDYGTKERMDNRSKGGISVTQ